MNYRSVSDLNSDIRKLALNLPNDIDLIVGIPRSGMLAGNLLALHMDLPLTDVDGLCDDRILQSGKRHKKTDISNVNKVLVIDDSVCHGTQMETTKQRIKSENLSYDILYSAVYITPKGHQYVDYWSEVVNLPRYFEWNIMHHTKLPQMCVDIDGVLCRDPTSEENDDGPNYVQFIKTVEPQIIPSKEIGWLVTSRLEKYRSETENWLNSHGIKYDNLIMMDHPDKRTRKIEGNHADFKADVYRSVEAELFIESSMGQSKQIVRKSGKPVYCYGENTMVYPDLASSTKYRIKKSKRTSEEYLRRFSHNPKKFVADATSHMIKKQGDLKHKLYLIYYKLIK